MFAKRKMTQRLLLVCVATLLSLLAVLTLALRRPPRAVLSTAINDAGTLIAVSYIQSDLLPNYDRVHTCLMQIEDQGVKVVASFTPSLRKAIVRDISEDGRVLLSAHTGVFVRTAPAVMQLVDTQRNPAGTSFVGKEQLQVVVWSESGLRVVSIGTPEERWELPLPAGQSITAANWTEQPLRLAIVTRSTEPTTTDDGRHIYATAVEVWEPDRNELLKKWSLSAEVDAGSVVAVNPFGQHVLVYNRVQNGQSRFFACNIGSEQCMVITEPPEFVESSLGEGFRFISDDEGMFTGPDGRIVVINSVSGECKFIRRVGDAAEQIDVTPDGSLIVMGGRLRPTFEVWRRNRSAMEQLLSIDLNKWRQIEGFIPSSVRSVEK